MRLPSPPRLLLLPILLVAALGGCQLEPTEAGVQQRSHEEAAEQVPPLAGFTVAIDPGHNGGNGDAPEVIDELVDVGNGEKPCDTTGTNTDDGYFEHEFNFDVASRLSTLLTEAGATVLLTRTDDTGVGPCITERTALANDAEASVSVSIHADGGPPDGSGFHIMEPIELDGHDDGVVDSSHELALSLADTIEAVSGMPPADYIGTDGINPRSDMGGLNLTTVPKVMVECGNMRNSHDAALHRDPEFRQSLAQALADGITDFLIEEPAPN
ncbi:N-acetylmuramoyl-L-alanine amidase [Stackebrandtia endophytica]|uniref:N-acetylmuramoyl-L-alanine amidase n=1 Tax=Stackebrandtia endophytica TaxID=1496996 RepID=A0A543ATQ3_9ACTN|nr:N-acetylmuramoyl-L-alanine amidase [Stackebrandtia endophytica]TQL75980.1 N-acetylmuramoyl-L-alanine amidase [Stackebrandtia endophytica]